MKRSIKTLVMTTIMLFAASECIQAQGIIEIKSMKFDQMGMGGRMVRLSDNGIFLDDAGMHFEGFINMTINGFVGKRLVCMVEPLDKDGDRIADRKGQLMNLTAFNVKSNQFNGELNVDIPYAWMDLKSKPTKFSYVITIIGPDGEPISSKTLNVDPQTIKVDGNKMGAKMMGDMFGVKGNSEKDVAAGVMMEGLLGGLFGPSVTAEHTCSACDGEGVCPECYGDAFLNPSLCRRCSRDPGICRRCKGSGTETVDID